VKKSPAVKSNMFVGIKIGYVYKLMFGFQNIHSYTLLVPQSVMSLVRSLVSL